MKLEVSKMSSEATEAGNIIISLKAVEEIVVKSGLGTKRSKPFYLIALKEDDVSEDLVVGKVVDLNMADYKKVERVSGLLDEHEQPISFTWLHIK